MDNLFKLLGVLLAAYTLLAVSKGEVYIKSGVWGRSIERTQEPARFWTSIAIYALLSLALLFVF